MTLEIILRAVFVVGKGERLDPAPATSCVGRLNLLANPRRAALPRAARGRIGYGASRHSAGTSSEWTALLFEGTATRREVPDLPSGTTSSRWSFRPAPGRSADGRPELQGRADDPAVAGHETTATALSWATELLSASGGAEAGGERVRGEEVYLDAVIKERSAAPRDRPGAPQVGRAHPDRGHLPSAGVTVAPSIDLVHRNPEIYPEPERFARALPGGARRAYTWIPFGGGVRRCLGAAIRRL